MIDVQPFPSSVDHRVSPLIASAVAIGLAVVAGTIGYDVGGLRAVRAERSGLIETITMAGPQWLAASARCQEKELAKHPSGLMMAVGSLTVREFCEATIFNAAMTAAPRG